MTRIVLQQVSSAYARRNRRRTLDHPVALRFVKKHVPATTYEELCETFPDGKAYFWGAKRERRHQIGKMPGALVLFRQSRRVIRTAVIVKMFVSAQLAQFLWGIDDEDGETWVIVYTMKNIHRVDIPAEDINSIIGRKPADNWQGMTALDGSLADEVVLFVHKRVFSA